MQVNISARHGHLSAESQEKIKDKVGKLQRFFDRVTAIEVTLNLEHNDSPEAEVSVSVEHKDRFIGTEKAGNLMAALDGAIRKVEQQLRKHKEKLKGHRSQHLGRVEVPTDLDEVDE